MSSPVTDSRQAMEVNRRHWDELARLHPTTPMYSRKIQRLREGGSNLRGIELAEVGDVQGRRLLHLQCHIGTETVSWARQGAVVTGVDYSANALAAARELAAACDADIRFVESNVLDLTPDRIGRFGVVYTSWGVLGWIPDLTRWARVVASLLEPEGFFYIAEFHPVAWMFDDESTTPVLKYDYFSDEPLIDERDGSYADATAKVTNRRTYNFYYTIGGLITALSEAGLHVEFLHELPRMPEDLSPFMVPDDTAEEPGWSRMPDGVPNAPLSFTLRARPLSR